MSLKDIVVNKNTVSNLIYLTLIKTSEKEGRCDSEKTEVSP